MRTALPTSVDQEPAPGVVGRDGELAHIGRLLDAVHGTGPNVLVLTGDPGAGKSTLVDWAAEQGEVRGLRILRVRGSEGESGLGFSGLHQLLRPLFADIESLPGPQRMALRCAFGLENPSDPEARDPLPLRFGVVSLLSAAAARQPLLLLVDDIQWLDMGSLDILAFLARRLEGEPAAMLLAAREGTVPGRFDRDFPHLIAGPLDAKDAASLLDAQPQPPTGRARAQILEQAQGNPLALIELTRAAAKGYSGTQAGQAPPLTDRLVELFAADLPTLPAGTRRALLLIAAACTTELSDILRADPAIDADGALRPAEQAGLVRVDGGQVLLRHPLIRSAIYQAATFSERREAHLALAAVLTREPDRRAWHLAEAALGPDDTVADALADSAERFRARGGHAAAAGALERAAQLTPDPEKRVARLLAAARSAMYAGHPQWVGELTAGVPALTEDPVLRGEAALLGGWALGLTRRHDEALTLLFGVGESLAVTAPALAIGALGTAATSVYLSGDAFHRAELQRISELIPDQDADLADRAWILASIQPLTRRPEALARIQRAVAAMPEDSLSDLVVIGGAARVMDETELAIRLLGRAMDHLRRIGTAGTNATVAQALAHAHFDAGSWTAASDFAEEAFSMAAEAGAENVGINSPLLHATLSALHGDHEAARAQAASVARGADLRPSRSLYVRYRYALGMAAMVEGDHEAAYEQLRSTFTRDSQPSPVHYHASVYYLADLASVAVRAGQVADARAVLAATERILGAADQSPRIRGVLNRAAALLNDPDDGAGTERRFLAAIDDPACSRWAFEHALARLDFGEWLRRRRRAAEARPHLSVALDTFQLLGARPWLDRTAAELRAAGAQVPQPASAVPHAELTPQQMQIAELAAQGLTNRDIATRLYLSPRTVGYHLHRIFPKLGIRTRAQLRDALSENPPPPDD